MRRAKIVCTLGPATATPEKIRGLVQAGMDVARLNLSHGSHADHEHVYRMVRAASDETQHSVGVLVDLQGPKIRLGTLRRRPGHVGCRRRVHDHHRGRAGNRALRLDDLRGPAVRRPRRGPDPDRRRPARPRGGRRGGTGDPHPGAGGWQGQRPQGAERARCRARGAGAHRQGRRRSALRAGAAGGHGRAVLRTQPD